MNSSALPSSARYISAIVMSCALAACQPAFIEPEAAVRYTCDFDVKDVMPRAKPETMTIGGVIAWYTAHSKEGIESRFYQLGTAHARSAVITHDKGLFKRFFMTASTDSTTTGDGYIIEYNSTGRFTITRIPAEYAHHFPRLTENRQTLTRNYCPQDS